MAGGHSDYTHGTMEVEAQSGTFTGFMDLTKYGGCLIALIVIMPTLVFAVGMHWFSALIATFILGIVLGLVFKFKGAWYVALVGLSILTAFTSIILSIIN